MALDHVQHVEAVAIMQRMLEARMAGVDPQAWEAAEQWLGENHPPPEAYTAAVLKLSGGRRAGDPAQNDLGL